MTRYEFAVATARILRQLSEAISSVDPDLGRIAVRWHPVMIGASPDEVARTIDRLKDPRHLGKAAIWGEALLTDFSDELAELGADASEMRAALGRWGPNAEHLAELTAKRHSSPTK